MANRDSYADRDRRMDDDESHATTGGAAAAGAVTGGVVGMAAGPVGAAVGAVGGAIVGAVSEGLMHSGDDDNVGSASARTWESESPRYRQRWQSQYGSSGGRYEDYEPHYRYGWEMRNNPRYRGRNWSDIEPDVRTDWESRYSETPWDQVRDTFRSSWDSRSEGADYRDSRMEGSDERTVQLREEELVARKQRVQTGEVEVGKRVVAEEQTIDVPVAREEVYVERRPVDRRPASDAEFGSGREEIRVPVMEEEVDVAKRAYVTEEIEVGKRVVQDTERVSGTVRREEAVIDHDGDAEVHHRDAGLPHDDARR